jgi:cytochrome c biogenesis protein ResB
MAWLWNFLVSRNTAIVLLVAVVLILIVAAALPNPVLLLPADAERLQRQSPTLSWLGSHFNSMKMGNSPVFGVVGVLLVISTTLCSIDRVVKRVRANRERTQDTVTTVDDAPIRIRDASAVVEKIDGMLRADRWRIRRSAEGAQTTITATKGDIGFWGSVFFHGVLVTLLGGLVLFSVTGFYATVVITEGQHVRLARENLTRIDRMPLLGMTLPDVTLFLRQFSSEYHDDFTAVDHTAELVVTDHRRGRTWTEDVKVNRPFRYGGIDFVIHLQGYSPNFIVYKSGKPVFDSYAALDVTDGKKDTLEVPGERLLISARFFPDMARTPEGGVYSKGPRPRNPYFGVEITKGGERLFRGLVGKGESVSFGEYRLVFNDLRPWVTLNLVRETGIGLFFVSSMIGLVGVLVRMVDPDRKIVASVTVDEASIRYSARHFEGMLREYAAAVAERLRTESGG